MRNQVDKPAIFDSFSFKNPMAPDLVRKKMDRFTACCCCSRRSSCLTVAIFNVILIIIYFVSQWMELHTTDNEKKDSNDTQKLDTTKDIFAYENETTYIVELMFSMTTRLIICGFLIFGCVKRIKKFIFPYVCMGITEIIYGVGKIISRIILLSSLVSCSAALEFTAIYVTVWGILLYLWIVVYFFYCDLQREQSENTVTQKPSV